VVGLDLAGDKALRGGSQQRMPSCRARGVGMPRAVHTGEIVGAESAREAIDFPESQRVDHSVQLGEDPSLLEPLRKLGITLQKCPTGSVQTRAIPSLSEHPIDRHMKESPVVTVNTDGRTNSNTTLSQKCLGLSRQSGWRLDQSQCIISAAAGKLLLAEGRKAALHRMIPDRWPDP